MNRFHEFADQLIQTSARGIVFADQQTCILSVNDAALDHFGGLSADELIGVPLAEAVVSSTASQLVNEASVAMAAEGRTGEYFGTAIPADGVCGSVTLRCTEVASREEGLIGYAYVFGKEDVSAEREYDKIMINNLMRNSQDLIYFKDLDSCFTCVSDSMIERLGATSNEDLIGKSDFDFCDSECATMFYNDEQEVIRTGTPVIGKTAKVVRPNGTTSWVLISKMPLIDEDEQVVGTFGISKDITLQKEFEIELELTHKKLLDASRYAGMAEIATNVIHNVGNVLNSINVSVSQTNDITKRLKGANLTKIASMIKENDANPRYFAEDAKGKRIPEYLAMIAADLANDQQDIQAEIEATKRHLEHIKMIVSMQQEYATANCVIERVDVAEVVDDAIRMSSGSLERHKIQLCRDFRPGLTVAIDKHRVLQILVNLIRNAKHAMQEVDHSDRLLTITVTQDQPDFLSIIIADTGVGISEENLLNLFTHGFTTKRDGHGFGLHSGANSAKELGGSLVADSKGLGHGATFTLTLPLAACENEAIASAPILHNDLPTALAVTELP